jgi:putative endonuclease
LSLRSHELRGQATLRRRYNRKFFIAKASRVAQLLRRCIAPDQERAHFRTIARGECIASCFAMKRPKRIVYVLKSDVDPRRYYTGVTSDLAARIEAHNAGRVPHTANGKPWMVDVVIEFSDERRAVTFERYLKSGSGGAFAKRHLR